MAIAYMFASTSFAALCSLCWLLMGGGFGSALMLYLLSGQVAMIALIGRAYLLAQQTAKTR